jgi:UDP:flavonoid glycosyltransferase YjiC (YdhE family)
VKVLPYLPNIYPRRRRAPFRIYISVNGEGYGHSSRALAIASHLDPETVVFGSYGYVLERLQRSGHTCVEVLPEVKFFGEDGSFELSKTILKNSNLPLLVNKQIRQEQKVMVDYGITCVLSDCRFTPVLAASKLGLPSLYMTNQTQFEHFFQRRHYKESNGKVSVGRVSASQSRTLAEAPKAIQDAILSGAAEPGVDFVVKTIFREVNEIVIADFPPPDTVCLPLLSHKPQVKRLQRLVGPVISWKAHEVFPQLRPGFGAYVVGTLGGHQYREPLFDALIDAANRLPHVYFDIFSSFRVSQKPDNLRLIDFSDNPETYYKAADLVVTQAGHSTAMELLTLGKPSLLVPDYKQIEQECNAQRLVELGVSTQIVYPELSGSAMAERIQHHLQTRTYEKSAYRLAALADSLGGAAKVAEVLKEYALRVKAY